MIRIACSTGIRGTAPLGAACRVIAEIGFRYADPLAIEGWHISPAQIAADPASEAAQVRAVLDRIARRLNQALSIAAGEGMTLVLETHAGAIVVHPAAPAWR